MSFTQYRPQSNIIYEDNGRQQNSMIKQSTYPYSIQEMQYQMYCFYQQNRYLQQQYLQQQYKHMLEQQLLLKNNLNEIKMQEPTNTFEKHSDYHLTEDVGRCIQNTEPVSKSTFKRVGNKINKSKPQKNQTKNIPKNYGKAIVSFIQNNKQMVRKVLSKFSSMTIKKNKINSIADLRAFWLQSEQKDFSKVIRVLSNIFLRHFSLEYIFNSRISNFAGHVKYRARLIEALRNPECFTSIKQY